MNNIEIKSMKRIVLFFVLVLQFNLILIAKDPTSFEVLSKISAIDSIKLIQETEYGSTIYMVWVTQFVDHDNPELGTFPQRVVYEHRSFDRPVVVVMEGYGIFSLRLSEPAQLLNANQITIEHRYFKKSRPNDSIPWSTLNIKNAAADQHKIIALFKPFYKSKWISTGISKGGQTTIFHRSFYPNDVDVSIPYVAPVNYSDIDERIFNFLDTVGTEQERLKIKNYQIELLKRKAKLMPKFKELISEKGWNFSVSIDSVYDLAVFEFSFAYWQWGGKTEIPDFKSADTVLFETLATSGAFPFFEEKSVESNRPFFFQALTEIGMYGYKTEPFKEYTTLKDVQGFQFTLPTGYKHIKFNPQSMQAVDKWVKTQGDNMLYIYGGQDAWSSTAAQPGEQTNSRRFFNPGGNHATRITSFPNKMQDSIISILESWLALEIERKP